MICARCDQPMTEDESTVYDIPGATGPGVKIRAHKGRCKPPPQPRTYSYPSR
ncbi:hypothetical protein ACFVW8_05100 [Streptomyces sp. NPDC058221]|uniref:hypothetical protein n=1 Tax=Streptomyces sp. NPDC058221 TaxID=3346388 RepID=UPI0036EEFA95